MATKKVTLIEQFWGRVLKRGVDDCWPWIGGRDSRGYGRAWLDGALRSVHRYSWMLTHGEIPPGMFVLHRCDNPPCVNPAHLFLGRQLDNVRDCLSKGRGNRAYGARHWMAKLSAAEVEQIRASTLRQWEIAGLFGITQSNVSVIRSGKTWKHEP